jgi:hypothetical protein
MESGNKRFGVTYTRGGTKLTFIFNTDTQDANASNIFVAKGIKEGVEALGEWPTADFIGSKCRRRATRD